MNNKIAYLILGVIVIIAVAVLVFVLQKPKTEAPVVQEEKTTEMSQIETEKSEVVEPEAKEPIYKSSIADCGIAGTVKFATEVSADLNTIKAWECFTDNLDKCHPAKIESTGMGMAINYEILGQEKNICRVFGPKVTQTGIKTVICNIPNEWIEFSFNMAEKQAPGKTFFKGYSAMGIVTAGGNIQYPDQTFKIECK